MALLVDAKTIIAELTPTCKKALNGAVASVATRRATR